MVEMWELSVNHALLEEDDERVVEALLVGKLLKVTQSIYGFTPSSQYLKFRMNDLVLVLETQHPKSDSQQFRYRLLTHQGHEAYFDVKASSVIEANNTMMVFFEIVSCAALTNT